MSHKTEIATKLSKLTYLGKGMEELKYKYTIAEKGKKLKTKGRYNVEVEVDVLIHEIDGQSTKDAVGFNKKEDGTYELVGDFYDLRNVSKESMRNDVTTMSLKCEVNDKLMSLGYELSETNDSNELELTFTNWN